ncbi:MULTISPECIES: nucleotide exchange factor GrpE [Aminobacterium]|jgi:molecular chaperone GrpE (heat shock protein)|uniref:nucleotide exchange factor GrpE n=1 Tax=Aminobacterium TaxID=81466 RepID=UPI001BCC8B12|nr:nucleotide exchange factor GrpE [Aminobacterium sp. UBA4987]
MTPGDKDFQAQDFPMEEAVEKVETAELPQEKILEIVTREKEEMEKVIEELKSENEALRTAAASARADFHNFKNRVDREKERYIRLAGERIVLLLLPVLDNLDRALSQSEKTEEQDIRTGVAMVRRQFLSVLESVGVSEIPTEGEVFSPACHEAVGIEDVEDPEKDGIVILELQKGYRMADKVIRASRVKVGKYRGNKEANQDA